MKKYQFNEITPMQFMFMIHGAQVGIGIFSLPRDLAKIAGTDGWISLLIGWAFALLSSLLIVLVLKKHPDSTLYDLLPRLFGAVIGKLLHVVYALYYAFTFWVTLLASVFVIKIELLPKTPFVIVVLLFALPIYTLAKNQVRVLGRYSELTFWGAIWLLIVYLIPFGHGEWLNFLPVLKDGWKPILSAVQTTTMSFVGFETVFVLYPFLKNPRKAVPCVIGANLLTLLIYGVSVGVCTVFFSPDDLTSYSFPVLKVVKVIEFRFLERFEIIFLIAYLFMLSRVWVFNLYCSLLGSSQLFHRADHRPHLRVVLAVVVLISVFFTPTYEQVDTLEKVLGKIGFYAAFLFPLFLWGYDGLRAKVRKGGAS
ncbi:GerAB/ArcD/ProY family transporter [Tumebacillus flagellatus]|uniref:Uncharacterized protein n=1 Tax=Tumebacillus flagellatus TaxID=1157490 RepID=A0A074LRT6_9BACL|nr:endospore germination permease [Tumebacillus flagellatus]KEO83834.1 hypothetical protein EL26_07915 [Tumebacillus flagellatus]